MDDDRNSARHVPARSLYRVARLWGVLPLALVGQGPREEWLRYATAGWYALAFALAVVGLWSIGRGLVTTPWLFGLLLAVSFTSVHAVYWTDMRMRTAGALRVPGRGRGSGLDLGSTVTSQPAFPQAVTRQPSGPKLP